MSESHYCKEHDTVWFKSKNMRNYAHPVKTSDGETVFDDSGKQKWCNEPESDTATVALESHKSPPSNSSPETGMAWNNLGARIGDGSIDRDYPRSATKIKSQYYKYIFGVTGITTDKEE